MLTIAGGIILAFIILVVGALLLSAMFVGFQHSVGAGCATMVIFGFLLFTLAMCVFA